MGKGFLDMAADILVDALGREKLVGRYGEFLTERELKWVDLLGRHGKVLRNVYLPKDAGETSEIDVLYITQKGIFVFESKNYSGWIFGDEKSQYWTMSLPNKEKNRFYNPIKQNKTHMKWLKNYIGENIPLFSIIVFSERCELKKITVQSPDVKVIKRDKIYVTIREIWNNQVDCLCEDEINELHLKLEQLTHVGRKKKKEHVDHIKEKLEHQSQKSDQGNEIPKMDVMENDLAKKLCPRCGSELVLRIAKQGENKGKQFYGCSSFPKCRYIEKNLKANAENDVR